MKIRTITTGFELKCPLYEKQFREAAEFTKNAQKEFERRGYPVQTLRISTQPWEDYFQSKKQIIELIKEIENLTKKYNLNYFSVGTTRNPENIPFVYDIIKNSSLGFCTATICDNKKINFEAARQTAKLIRKLSKIGPNGSDNRRFAALFNTKAGSPFFPVAYHKGEKSFAIGLENSDLVYINRLHFLKN